MTAVAAASVVSEPTATGTAEVPPDRHSPRLVRKQGGSWVILSPGDRILIDTTTGEIEISHDTEQVRLEINRPDKEGPYQPMPLRLGTRWIDAYTVVALMAVAAGLSFRLISHHGAIELYELVS